MSNYVETNLNKKETLVQKAKIHGAILIPVWLKGILLCWLFLIPLIQAIIETIRLFRFTDLGVTSKRVIGKTGIIKTETLDAPLSKVQNVSVNSGLWGKIFGYGTITIQTAVATYCYKGIKNVEMFKNVLLQQVEQAEEDKIREQAAMMAQAVRGVAIETGNVH